jgi:hypothetical protein
VDEVHLGNLSEATAHSGLPYGTLRDLYDGSSTNPVLKTLEALARAYGLAPGWFADTSGRPPIGMVEGTLPPDPESGRGHLGRRIAIPLAAWPFARLFLVLEPYLSALPATPDRLILGGAMGPEAVRQRLTGFLFGPLLDAQAAGLLVLLGADPPFRGGERPSPEARREWVETLRRLGRFWEVALSDLLARATR